jgi:hypothetical protein
MFEDDDTLPASPVELPDNINWPSFWWGALVISVPFLFILGFIFNVASK